MAGAGAAAWVVEADDEIGLGGGADPAFDRLPRRVQVRKRDRGMVMAQWRAERGRGGERGGNAWRAADVDLAAGEFEGRACHGIDPGIAGADEGDGVAGPRLRDGRGHPFLLRADLAGQDPGARAKQIADLVHVLAEADDHAGAAKFTDASWSDQVACPG